jgi:hypothetical protein
VLNHTANHTLADTDHRFYSGISWIIALVVIAGFSKALIRHEFDDSVLNSTFTRAHAVIFLSWIALFVTQTTLIATRQPLAHMRLGRLGAALVGAIAIMSIISTVLSFRHGEGKLFWQDPHAEVFAFLVLAIFGLIARHKRETHKRLMLIATVSLIGAAIIHLPFVQRLHPQAYVFVQDSFIVAGIVYDVATRRRIHPAYLWGGLLLLATQYLVSQPLPMIRS